MVTQATPGKRVDQKPYTRLAKRNSVYKDGIRQYALASNQHVVAITMLWLPAYPQQYPQYPSVCTWTVLLSCNAKPDLGCLQLEGFQAVPFPSRNFFRKRCRCALDSFSSCAPADDAGSIAG